MSALPPKADMCSATMDVRFVPIADILQFSLENKKPPASLAGGNWHFKCRGVDSLNTHQKS